MLVAISSRDSREHSNIESFQHSCQQSHHHLHQQLQWNNADSCQHSIATRVATQFRDTHTKSGSRLATSGHRQNSKATSKSSCTVTLGILISRGEATTHPGAIAKETFGISHATNARKNKSRKGRPRKTKSRKRRPRKNKSRKRRPGWEYGFSASRTSMELYPVHSYQQYVD